MPTSRHPKQQVGGALRAPCQQKKETKKMSKVKINPSVREGLEKLVVAGERGTSSRRGRHF